MLEAECPRTLGEALEAAGNLKDYRLCPEGVDSPEEYVHHILEDSEVYYLDGFIEQFVDMDRMAKALMEETGAVEAAFCPDQSSEGREGMPSAHTELPYSVGDGTCL